MPCNCDRICSCVLQEGPNVSISGTGSAKDPYVISATGDGGGGGSAITGEIIMYGGLTVPAGWLAANGQAVSREVYDDLFAVIGSTYGPGDGSTTFNVPDLAGRFPLGADGPHPAGQEGGAFVASLTISNIPAHTHTMAHTHSINHTHAAGSTGSGGLHDHPTKTNNADGSSTVYLRQGNNDGSPQDTSHIIPSGTHSHTVTVPAFVGSSGGSSAASTGSVGSGEEFNVTPPYTAVNFLIHV